MPNTETQAVAALERVILENLKEQRSHRRWKIFFRLIIIAFILLFVLSSFFGANWKNARQGSGNITAVVDINGIIMEGGGVSFKKIKPLLTEAFENKQTKGVVIRINSPGGSPVQSAMIYDEINRLKKKYKSIRVYAVIHDVGASGGYYIAAAADEIYANPSSIVGSIGVRMDSYGVEKIAEKIGIESRTITAGSNKNILDPFKPISESARKHIEQLLASTHQQFINAVKQGRGERLQLSSELFTGLFWTGVEAKEMGLIDGFMTEYQVASKLIGAEELVEFSPEMSLLEQVIDQGGKTMINVFNHFRINTIH